MAVRYIPYYPNTLEGQALLDNFVRTKRMLSYRDNGRVIEKIQQGMPYYELETREMVGSNPKQNLVVHGDCLSTCAYLRDQGIEVDLVYIDPPFDSGADYSKKVYIRRNPLVQKAIAEAQGLEDGEQDAFEAKMYGDIWTKENYLNWMYENLMAIKSVMSEKASIYVELDSHIGHYVKVLMDEIFGEQNFINEIVWKRTFSHSDVGQGAKHLGRLHDVIFLYSKSEDYKMNIVYTPYTEEYINNFYKYTDKDGRKYRLVSLLGPGGASKGNPKYELMGVTRYWAFSKETMQKMVENGLIVQTKEGAVPQKKRYLDESEGVPLQDIWVDIAAVQGGALENTDYATQKPEALLERIIKASSDEGMLVADFFGGSGVAATVAHKLGRRFIHGDININSLQTARDRLVSAGAEFEIKRVQDGIALFRNPAQTMDKLRTLIPGLNTNEKLNKKYWAGAITDSKLGMIPVYLPNLLDTTQRVFDTVELNKIIREALPDLPTDEVKKIVVYYVDAEDINKLYRFYKEQNTETLIELELRDLKQVLDDVVMEDEATWTLSEVQDGFFSKWQITINSFHSNRLDRAINDANAKAEQQHLKKISDGKDSNFNPIVISDEGLEGIEFVSLDCHNAEIDAPWTSDAEIKVDAKTSVAIINGKKTADYWDGKICTNDDNAKPLRLKIRNILGDETIFVIQ